MREVAIGAGRADIKTVDEQIVSMLQTSPWQSDSIDGRPRPVRVGKCRESLQVLQKSRAFLSRIQSTLQWTATACDRRRLGAQNKVLAGKSSAQLVSNVRRDMQ